MSSTENDSAAGQAQSPAACAAAIWAALLADPGFLALVHRSEEDVKAGRLVHLGARRRLARLHRLAAAAQRAVPRAGDEHLRATDRAHVALTGLGRHRRLRSPARPRTERAARV